MYEAIVGNIGTIGDYPTKDAALAAIKETIANSGRADPYGYVIDTAGELVAEYGLQG